jgi:hypothetical protein
MDEDSGTGGTEGTGGTGDQRDRSGASGESGSRAREGADADPGDGPVVRTDCGRSTPASGGAFGVGTTGDGRVQVAAPPSNVLDAVFEAVGQVTGRAPERLAPLYDSIDPDALGRLFEHDPSAVGAVEASFSYAGCDVTVERLGAEVRVAVEAGPGTGYRD